MVPFADVSRVPVTERVSPHALDMEARGAKGVLEALAACDAEMWADSHADDDGTRDSSVHPGLTHPTVVANIARLALAVSRCVASDTPETPAAVLVVGCGTSGRLAFQCVRACEGNPTKRKRKRAIFRHVLAGGDAALFQSAESCEDDRERGAIDFHRAVASYGPTEIASLVVVGVSCGLSAPYVSSFLAEAGRFGARREGKKKKRVARFALGFNPTRDAPERGGFHALVPRSPSDPRSEDETDDVCFVNPVLGPELVAGSSRLKGGSATKIILDAAFAVAAAVGGAGAAVASDTTEERTAAELTSRALSAFEVASRRTHVSISRDAASASACASAAAAVAAGGDVSLVSVAEFAEPSSGGHSSRDEPEATVAGTTVAALIDASEQRPTFGTPAEKYRAFGGGGWEALVGTLGGPPPGRSDVSWDAYVRDAESKRRGANRRRPKPATPVTPVTPATAQTFLLVLFAPGVGARAARQRRAARLAMGLERAKHARGSARRASFAFLCVRAAASDPKTPPWVDEALGARDSGLASAFGADAIFVDLAEDEAATRDVASSVEAEAPSAALSTSASAIEPPGRRDARAPRVSRLGETLLVRLAPRVAELGAKLALNAVSVAAHALSGKTLAGRMIDVRVSNAKLYHRAARAVAAAAGTDLAHARDAIARACGVEPRAREGLCGHAESENAETDGDVPPAARDAREEAARETAFVIARASALSSVVPIAVLLARGACTTVEDARAALDEVENDARAALSRLPPNR